MAGYNDFLNLSPKAKIYLPLHAPFFFLGENSVVHETLAMWYKWGPYPFMCFCFLNHSDGFRDNPWALSMWSFGQNDTVRWNVSYSVEIIKIWQGTLGMSSFLHWLHKPLLKSTMNMPFYFSCLMFHSLTCCLIEN